MNARQFLNMFENQVSGISRDGPNGLMFFLDQAHAILCDSDAEQNIVYDASTGLMPVLATTAGVFEYDAPAGMRRVDGVYSPTNEDSTTDGILAGVNGSDYGERLYEVRIERVDIAGNEYIRIPYIKTRGASETERAKVIFTQDPNTTTDYYYLYGYSQTAELLSDSMELQIHKPYDILYLAPALLKLIQGWQDGNLVEALEYINLKIKPAYQKVLNRGEQGTQYQVKDHF